MTKAKVPLFGFHASGTLADSITLQKTHSGVLIRKKPIPTNPRSLAQMYHRWLYYDYVAWWTHQSVATKNEYESKARRQHFTGMNLWLQERLSTLPDILVGYHLDHISNNFARDFSKNLHHGTAVGPTLVDGLVDNAYSFDGVNDRVEIPDPVGLIVDGAHSFSIEMDFYPTTWVPPDGMWQNLLSLWSDYYVAIRLLNDGRVSWVMYPVGADVRVQLPSTNSWYHLCATYTPTAGKTLTITDVGFASHPGTGTPAVRALENRLAMRSGLDRRYLGYIDNFIIYNRLITASDIRRHSERRYPL